MDEAAGVPVMGITDLPEEILDLIISNLSPYSDLKAASRVCKQWYRLVKGAAWQKRVLFERSVASSTISWSLVSWDGGPTIAERYSHCACYADKSMYVFGGCTSTGTTFNDLWRFDLTSRQWIRPLAMGTYPSPKACASMVLYRDELILFGGWNHPSPYPLHQAPRFFNELHSYSLETNRWSHLLPQWSPRPVAGHSACVTQDRMVVFGGCHTPGVGSNDTWVYDFVEKNWERQHTTLPLPAARYGQSQVSVDESHILILGGCGGPNQIFSDLWLLSMTGSMWTWSEVTVNCPEFSPAQLWCHPACKVGDYAVVLSRTTKSPSTPEPPSVMKGPVAPGPTATVRLRAERVWVPPRGEPSPRAERVEFPARGEASPRAEQVGLPSRGESGPSADNLDIPDLSDFYPYVYNRGHSSDGLKLNEPTNTEEVAAGNKHSDFRQPDRECSNTRTGASKRKLSTLAQAHAAAAGEQDSSSDENSDFRLQVSRNQRYCHTRNPAFSSARCDSSQSDLHPGTSEGSRSDEVLSAGKDHPSGSGADATPSTSRDPPVVPESSRQQARRFCGLSSENNSPSSAGLPGIRPGLPSVRPNAMKNRTKQLDVLRRHADRIKQHLTAAARQQAQSWQRNGSPGNPQQEAANGTGRNGASGHKVQTASPTGDPKTPMYLHVLDLSRVVCHGEATWQEIHDQQMLGAPEETVFYSLVSGRAELLMFGGIQKDLTSMQIGMDIDSHVVRNDLYVISAPRQNLR